VRQLGLADSCGRRSRRGPGSPDRSGRRRRARLGFVCRLGPGRVLAVTGAAGAVGGYVVQLAKIAGLTVVADASEADEYLVQSLGADVVVLRGPDLAERFRSQFPDGVDGQRGLRVTPVIVSTYAEEWEKLDRLRRLAEEGKVTLRVAGTYPAEQAAEAHRRFEAGGVRGRLVLVFD
jgi:NADPH2:quinone reductase